MIHHAPLNGLQIVVRLSLDTRLDHECKKDIESDLKLAVAHFGKPTVVGRQDLFCPVPNVVTTAAHSSLDRAPVVVFVHVLADDICYHGIFCLQTTRV